MGAVNVFERLLALNVMVVNSFILSTMFTIENDCIPMRHLESRQILCSKLMEYGRQSEQLIKNIIFSKSLTT